MSFLSKERGMPKHVLVVDDEATILIAFKKLLESPELEVDVAESLEDAQELMSKRSYQAVIADLRLSGIAGEEGLEIIRYVKERDPETRIILITAYGNQDVMKRAYNMGASFYFEKPVSTNVIKDALKTMGVILNTI
jgi:two-component system response regulator (stage 0 sporulation protein F)